MRICECNRLTALRASTAGLFAAGRLSGRCLVPSGRWLEARRLTQVEAGKLLGIPQPHVSDLLNGRARKFSAERLMTFLAALGYDVEVRVKRARRAHGRVSVVVAA